MLTLKQILIRTGWALAGVLLVIYIIHQGWAFLSGPRIVLDGPGNGAVFHEQTIHVFGTATHTTFISLNGRPIFIDERGRFNEVFVLARGSNIITLYARDRFGNETTDVREIVGMYPDTPLSDAVETKEEQDNTNAEEQEEVPEDTEEAEDAREESD
jgi:hypothetical protein